jgi:hypothetical protein
MTPSVTPSATPKPAAPTPVALQHRYAAMKKEKELAHVQYSSRDGKGGSMAPQRSDVYTTSLSQRSTHRQLYASGQGIIVSIGLGLGFGLTP